MIMLLIIRSIYNGSTPFENKFGDILNSERAFILSSSDHEQIRPIIDPNLLLKLYNGPNY